MAALSEADRAELWAKFMRTEKEILRSAGGNSDLSKVDIRALFDDLDDWLDANKASANSAIRQPLRNNAENSIKYAVLGAVAVRRALKGV